MTQDIDLDDSDSDAPPNEHVACDDYDHVTTTHVDCAWWNVRHCTSSTEGDYVVAVPQGTPLHTIHNRLDDLYDAKQLDVQQSDTVHIFTSPTYGNKLYTIKDYRATYTRSPQS